MKAGTHVSYIDVMYMPAFYEQYLPGLPGVIDARRNKKTEGYNDV